MDFLSNLTPQELVVIQSIVELSETCGYEAEHTEHATWLALRIFDDLQGLHGLGREQRTRLIYAGLLHDVGWSEGWRGHHKTGLRIIQETPLLPFDSKERLIIGSIVRYHRRALPDPRHDHYAALEPAERGMVDQLAAILRLADGLDRTHRGVVRDVACKFNRKKISVKCAVRTPAPEEEKSGVEKGDLIEKVYGRKLALRFRSAL